MLLVTGGGFRWRSQGEDYEQLPRYLVARALHRLHAEMREVCLTFRELNGHILFAEWLKRVLGKKLTLSLRCFWMRMWNCSKFGFNV